MSSVVRSTCLPTTVEVWSMTTVDGFTYVRPAKGKREAVRYIRQQADRRGHSRMLAVCKRI